MGRRREEDKRNNDCATGATRHLAPERVAYRSRITRDMSMVTPAFESSQLSSNFLAAFSFPSFYSSLLKKMKVSKHKTTIVTSPMCCLLLKSRYETHIDKLSPSGGVLTQTPSNK